MTAELNTHSNHLEYRSDAIWAAYNNACHLTGFDQWIIGSLEHKSYLPEENPSLQIAIAKLARFYAEHRHQSVPAEAGYIEMRGSLRADGIALPEWAVAPHKIRLGYQVFQAAYLGNLAALQAQDEFLAQEILRDLALSASTVKEIIASVAGLTLAESILEPVDGVFDVIDSAHDLPPALVPEFVETALEKQQAAQEAVQEADMQVAEIQVDIDPPHEQAPPAFQADVDLPAAKKPKAKIA